MTDRPIKILLIEDNPGDALLIQRMLSKAKDSSFEVEWADHLSKGLEGLARGGIDVILLDLGLPDSQGHETLASVYAQAPVIPIVILTGLDDEAVAMEALKKGAQDYLVKGTSIANALVHSIRYAIERQRGQKERLDYVTGHDPLTGLPNRSLFTDSLDRCLSESADKARHATVLSLCVPCLKDILRLYGHEVYKTVLLEVAKRLKYQASDIVGKGCTAEPIAFMGEGEFAIALPGVYSTQEALKWAKHILGALSMGIVVNGQEISLTGCIGIGLTPINGKDGETLLRKAHTAMSQAGAKGVDKVCLYTPEIDVEVSKKWELEKDLRTALKHGEFILHYQPVIKLVTGQKDGVEALLRWKKADKMVSPMEFIPFAEETGLIIPIGEWVVYTACAQIKDWQDRGYSPVRVSVNLSPSQFAQPNLLEMVKTILKEVGLSGTRLGLEVTESTAMRDIQKNVEILRAFKEMGTYVAIDDFGTGYSSLAWLQRLPINALKIDRSFINYVPTDPNNNKLVEGIVTMAHNLGLETIAEGVEKAEQKDFLHSVNCDKAQGYLFSRPVPAEDIMK